MDASVAAKWVLPSVNEPLHREALHLAGLFVTGQLRFVVPDFFWIEMGNVLWKAARSKRIDALEFDESLSILESRDLETIPTRRLLARALSIAFEFDRSVYDSVYIALAEATSSLMITADQKLANAVAPALPVVWLGSNFALSL